MEEIGTYTISINCDNCGFSGTEQKIKGLFIETMLVRCPNCDCLSAHEGKHIEKAKWYLNGTPIVPHTSPSIGNVLAEDRITVSNSDNINGYITSRGI